MILIQRKMIKIKNRIEICGNIASGKTTLSRSFTHCGLPAVEEKFLQNPFIKKFYQSPALFSFETEISFLLQHYHAIKTTNDNSIFTCDYSLTLDRAYADVTLPSSRQKIFLGIANELEEEIGHPLQIIHLKCPEEVLLSRIRERNRSFENTIDIGYLKALSEAIQCRIENLSAEIELLTIDSHKTNFVSGVKGIKELEGFCLS